MLSTLLAAGALALAAPATGPLGELPVHTTTHGAACLRATGTPGELIRKTPSTFALLTAGPSGVATSANLLAHADGCPVTAARANGAGVIAYTTSSEATDDVRAFLRDPGGRWADAGIVMPVTQTDDAGSGALVLNSAGPTVASAIAPGGRALVAGSMLSGPAATPTAAVDVAWRAPGGGFAPAQTLASARTTGTVAPSVLAGMSAAGEAVVAWSLQPTDATKPRTLWVAIAPAGGPFGAPVQVGELRQSSPFSLAVADDGRALLAFASGDDVRVAERSPGGAFAAATVVGRADDPFVVLPAAALRADGAAVVVWTELLRGRASEVTRDAPGPFGAPQPLAPPVPLELHGFDVYLSFIATLFGVAGEVGLGGDVPDDQTAANPRATYGPDGRPLITWGGYAERDGVHWPAPQVSSAAGTQVLGSELRDVGSMTPLVTADGRVAAAWTDNDDAGRSGRVHVAVQGVPIPADPRAPHVTVRGPRSHVLDKSSRLSLRVTCDAACDVRVQVADSLDATGTLTLSHAGHSELVLEPTIKPIAPLRTGPVRLLVRSGAPGAGHAREQTTTLRLRRRPGSPVPVVHDLVARRSGSRVIVTFRTAPEAAGDQLWVVGLDDAGRTVAIAGSGASKPRTRFHEVLEGAGAVTTAAVYVFGDFLTQTHAVKVAVEG